MTNTERKKHVEDWQAGGLSAAAFCRGRNLKYHTFRLWIKKYAKQQSESAGEPESSGRAASMVRLNVPRGAGPLPSDVPRGIEISIGAFRVVVGEGMNLSYLEDVLRAVRGAAL